MFLNFTYFQSKIIVVFAILMACKMTACAQFYYDEKCIYPTGLFIPLGDAPGYTSSLGIDPPGQGWLRLTTTATGQCGYVKFVNTFPSTMGVTIEFDFKVWGVNNPTWEKADGFSVFLFDGAYLNSFTIGESGGSLGYTNMPHAYVGVGIDEFGNFNNGRSKISIKNGNYQVIGGTPTDLGMNLRLEYLPSGSVRPSDADYFRRVKINIEPNYSGNGMIIDVFLKTTVTGTWQHILQNISITTPVPQIFGMGFASSTGAAYAYHEVKNVIARTPGDLYVYMEADSCPLRDDTVTITNYLINYAGSITNIGMLDTLPKNFSLLAMPTVIDATMNAFTATLSSDGRLLCSYEIDMNNEGTAKIIYKGKFDASAQNEDFYASSSITSTGDFIDLKTSDNHYAIASTLSEKTYIDIDLCDSTSIVFGNQIIMYSGRYSDTLQNVNGCDSIVFLDARFHPIDWMDLGPDQKWCLQDTSYIFLSTEGEFVSYQWSTGDTTSSIVVRETGTYKLTVSNNLGCTREDSVKIEFLPTPEVHIISEPENFCKGAKITLTASGNDTLETESWTYLWSTAATSQEIEIEDIGFYSVTITDKGCVDSDTLEIKFCCPEDSGLPNVITPSTKDGINDYFEFKEEKNFPQMDLNIYDKWGRKVFRTHDPKFQWDGTVGGKLEGGTYFWVLDLDKGCQFHGSITVL